jgi:hypothetical protein
MRRSSPRRPTKGRSAAALLPALICCALLTACVPHRLYNSEPDQYLRTLEVEAAGAASAELAIIEFDDRGLLWKREQLEDAVELIRKRNAEAEDGVLVVVYIHGWKNNADPDDPRGALDRFRRSVIANAEAQRSESPIAVNHVVGVFLGWRGDTSDIPIQEQFTFWDRHAAAERLVSLNMRETLFRVMQATKERDGSKCFIVGHSMGGLIVGKTMAPTLTTLLLSSAEQGVDLPVDLVLLQNPALDALASWQFVDFLKRSGARLELRSRDGQVRDAPGPIIASITSESDDATGVAYPVGRSIGNLFASFRTDHPKGAPSQRYLATHAEGHVDFLVSHHAFVRDGEVVIEPVPDAYNDTPFWIIRASREISRDHVDTNNPLISRLIEMLIERNEVYRTDLETWIVARPLTTSDADEHAR